MITKTTLLQALSRHIGRANGITMVELVRECYRLADDAPMMQSIEAASRQLRDLITELRNNGEHICAHPASGYFMARDADELNDTCKFLVERAMTSLRQVSAMKKVALPDLYGQLHLPT